MRFPLRHLLATTSSCLPHSSSSDMVYHFASMTSSGGLPLTKPQGRVTRSAARADPSLLHEATPDTTCTIQPRSIPGTSNESPSRYTSSSLSSTPSKYSQITSPERSHSLPSPTPYGPLGSLAEAVDEMEIDSISSPESVNSMSPFMPDRGIQVNAFSKGGIGSQEGITRNDGAPISDLLSSLPDVSPSTSSRTNTLSVTISQRLAEPAALSHGGTAPTSFEEPDRDRAEISNISRRLKHSKKRRRSEDEDNNGGRTHISGMDVDYTIHPIYPRKSGTNSDYASLSPKSRSPPEPVTGWHTFSMDADSEADEESLSPAREKEDRPIKRVKNRYHAEHIQEAVKIGSLEGRSPRRL